MTLLYKINGEVSMLCDFCTNQTPYFQTLDILLNAVHFNAPISIDAGSSSWINGPGKEILDAGWQPTYTIDSTKHICSSCKGSYSGLVYKTAPTGVSPGAKLGHLGDPARTSMDEDLKLNKTELFKGPR